LKFSWSNRFVPFPDSTPAMHNESAIVSESATNEMTSQLQPRVVPGQIDTSLDCSQTAPAFPGSSKSILITSGKWHFREWFLFSFIKSVSRLNSKTYIPLVFFSGNFISYRLAWAFAVAHWHWNTPVPLQQRRKLPKAPPWPWGTANWTDLIHTLRLTQYVFSYRLSTMAIFTHWCKKFWEALHTNLERVKFLVKSQTWSEKNTAK